MKRMTRSADGVQKDVVYPHPPERVWRALTDPKTLAAWLLPNDFAPRLGHRFTFHDGRRTVHCEVTALEKERHLSYTWRRGQEPLSVVTWTLEPVGNGQETRVRLTHTGPQARAFVSSSWVLRFSRLLAPRPRLLLAQPAPTPQRSFR